jgi:hypothetical protein
MGSEQERATTINRAKAIVEHSPTVKNLPRSSDRAGVSGRGASRWSVTILIVRRNQASAVATKQNNFPIAKLFVRCSTVNAKIARIAQNTAHLPRTLSEFAISRRQEQ